jgi:anaerobic dimethyl sulfoxide reductase subunit A
MAEESLVTKILTDTLLSRRTFLKWSAVLGGTAALAGGANIGLRQAATALAAPASADANQGKWLPIACWHNCGGRCLNVAYVQDGVVLKQKTDDTHPDSPDYPQQRGCARGRSQRHQVFGADRLKYPMKRKTWAPGGGNKDLRGRDEWVRISWDEALSIVSSEMKRVKDTYGNKSLFLPQFATSGLVNAYGGAVASYGVSSDGSWLQVQGNMAADLYAANDRLDLRKSKLIVLWNSNPIWSSGGDPTYNYLQAKKAGAKIIFVDPFYNNSAQALADEWIPVRPATDAALLLGMAHYMITNNLQDQDFLDKYTSGFDASHMPSGADPKENFKDYVLGTYDGVPKTPEWASEICGTPPETIRHFAQEISTTKPTVLQASSSAARTYFGQQFCQAFLTVGWMTGNVGIPGGGVSHNYHSAASYGGASLVNPGGSGLPAINNPLFPSSGPWGGYGFATPEQPGNYAMAFEEMWDAVNNGEYTPMQGLLPEANAKGKIPVDIRLMYMIRDGSGGNGLNQSAGIPKGIQAFRKVEFVVVSDIVLSTVAKFADVVLPATTPWELDLGGFLTGNPEMVIWYSQVTQPLFEAKDTQWVESELAKRLGLDPSKLYPISRKQQAFNQLAGATVIKPDASGYEPLVTITADDIAGLGVEGKPQAGHISMQDLFAKGLYQVPRAADDKFGFIAGAAYRSDPVKNALKTASGKLEIHCQALSTKIAAYRLSTVPPIAQYRRPIEGYEDTFADWDKKIKGDFPLQMVTIHYPRRGHSVFDNILQLRRAFPQETVINSADAQARGIAEGDTVLVSSRHGKVTRPVHISDRVMPGVLLLGEGAWTELEDPQGVDNAGATNTLCGTHPFGQGEEPWNSTNVQVQKWTGELLAPDYTWPQRIPIKEA